MENTNNYPNLTDAENNYLVQAKALRPDATVDDLINSFLVLFPDRSEHDGLTPSQIRETLTSRVNDVLYRKDRGYAVRIAQTRHEYEQMFTDTFAVLNPLAQLNFYEQTFTHPKSKPSDKFKAINDAEKLKARLFPPPTPTQQDEIDRHRNLLKKEAARKRDVFSKRVKRFRQNAVYNALPEPLQKEIDNHPDADWYTASECIRDVLERHDRTQERAALDSSLPDNWADVLSDIDILEIDEQLSNGGLEKMTPDEVDALIQSYLDPQRKAAIDALKNS